MDVWSMGAVWALAFAFLLLVGFLPWLPAKAPEHRAEVWLDECSGCGLCVADCPYEALYMQARTDGHRRFTAEVMVIPENCVSCGICVGSCPSSTPFRHTSELRTGIDLPGRSIQHLRSETLEALSRLSGEAKVIVYGCEHAVDLQQLETDGVVTLTLPCIGALPPSFIDYAMRHGADGVFLTGCQSGGCLHRFGSTWTEGRLTENREPYLRRWVPRQRLHYFWAASVDSRALVSELARFRRTLSEQPQESPIPGPDEEKLI
jgi:coenzyme F420-reducing hydrogenase delta subunit/ferredoxin